VRLHTLASIFDGYSASDIKDICQSVQLKVVNEMFHTPEYVEPVNGESLSQPRDLMMKDFRETMARRKPSVSMDAIRAYYKWSEQFKAL
jgi:SpoVK/Ycf46/Vps4 family AAA+-type ATPase